MQMDHGLKNKFFESFEGYILILQLSVNWEHNAVALMSLYALMIT